MIVTRKLTSLLERWSKWPAEVHEAREEQRQAVQANAEQILELRALLQKQIDLTTRHEQMTHALARTILLQNGRKKCPLCGSEPAAFLPFGERLRIQARCPECGSLERHRLLWLFLQRETRLLEQPTRILHFAPERCLTIRLQQQPDIEHVTADLDGSKAMFAEDIQRLSFDDESFDAVICSHVLEHVPDDRRALLELHRVMRPNAWAVLLVPIDPKRATTYEDPSVQTPQERTKHFGQPDHVRVYGRDFEERILEAGFQLRVERPYEKLSPEEAKTFSIRDEAFYHCTK